MAELTIKDLNCEKCPKFNKPSCPYVDDGQHMWMDEDGNTLSDEQVEMTTCVVGCASHPLALQVLAKPVIKVLERCEKAENIRSTHYMPGGTSYEPTAFMNATGSQAAYSHAIELLKDGVK